MASPADGCASFGLPRVRLEGKRNAGNNQTAAEDVHGPLPSFGLSLLARLDAPEPAAGGVKLRLAAASTLSSSGDRERSHRGLSGAAHRTERRYRMADDGHFVLVFFGVSSFAGRRC